MKKKHDIPNDSVVIIDMSGEGHTRRSIYTIDDIVDSDKIDIRSHFEHPRYTKLIKNAVKNRFSIPIKEITTVQNNLKTPFWTS